MNILSLSVSRLFVSPDSLCFVTTWLLTPDMNACCSFPLFSRLYTWGSNISFIKNPVNAFLPDSSSLLLHERIVAFDSKAMREDEKGWSERRPSLVSQPLNRHLIKVGFNPFGSFSFFCFDSIEYSIKEWMEDDLSDKTKHYRENSRHVWLIKRRRRRRRGKENEEKEAWQRLVNLFHLRNLSKD